MVQHNIRDHGEAQSGEHRAQYSRLISHTLRLQASIMFITVVSLAALWTTLEAGRQRVAVLEHEFVESRKDWNRRWRYGGSEEINPTLVDERKAALLREIEKRLFTLFLSGSQGQSNEESWVKMYQERLKESSEFERKRREAFRLTLAIPNLAMPVQVDGLSLMSALPWALLGVALAVGILAQRQRTFEILLTWENSRRGRKDPRSTARYRALGSFYGGTLLRRLNGEGKVFWEYRRPYLSMLPEIILIGLLVLPSLYLSFKLMALYEPTAHHNTNSILFSYYSLLWFSTLVAGLLFLRARRQYRENIVSVVGSMVVGPFSIAARKATAALRFWLNLDRDSLSFYQTTRAMIIGLGLGSLFVPWMYAGALRLYGFQLLFNQEPVVSSVAFDGTKLEFFKVVPALYLEMRFQLLLAVMFFVLCMLERPLFTGKTADWISRVRFYFAVVILGLAGNFLFYLCVLEFQVRTDFSVSLLDSIMPLDNPGRPAGFPLLFYLPIDGFWVFLDSCLFLCFGQFCVRSKLKNNP